MSKQTTNVARKILIRYTITMQEQILQKWPTRLVLVRHGRSRYNEERELINRGILKTYTKKVKEVRNADISLSPEGRGQAKRAGIFLKKKFGHFDIIFSSPFQRAEETARIITKQFPRARFIIEERIREKEFGITDGLTPEELRNLFPYEYERKQKEKKYYYTNYFFFFTHN